LIPFENDDVPDARARFKREMVEEQRDDPLGEILGRRDLVLFEIEIDYVGSGLKLILPKVEQLTLWHPVS
jgi:hypothetical protein